MAVPDESFDFERLLAPISLDVFQTEYWERKPLVIRRGVSQYYRDIFSLQSVDDLLASCSSASPSVHVVKDGVDLPLSRIVPEGMVNLSIECILREYSKGATLVLPQIQEAWPALRSLCHRLSTDCSARFQVNGYLTPAEAQGLGVHYDTHDVFVAQIAGEKHWSLYESPVRLPLATQPFARNSDHEPALVDEFDLTAGDLLYLPRGVVHEAVSRNGMSLHLTIGILPISWADLLLSLLHSAVAGDAAYRESLPLGFATRDARPDKIQAELKRLMRKLGDEADYESAFEEARAAARLTSPINVRGRLCDLEALKELSLDTSVSVRDHVDWQIERRGDEVCLQFHGKEICMPSHVEDAVHFIRTVAGPFFPAQLPDSLTQEGRVTLVKRLVREGLLTMNSNVPEAQVGAMVI